MYVGVFCIVYFVWKSIITLSLNRKEVKTMKKVLNVITKFSAVMAPMALMLATMTANSTCFFYSYQPEVPQKLIKKTEND